jgi:hypothetical protein
MRSITKINAPVNTATTIKLSEALVNTRLEEERFGDRTNMPRIPAAPARTTYTIDPKNHNT